VFPWAGVVVLDVEYEAYAEAVSGQWISHVRELLEWNHGVLHFIQALGSPQLQNHGLRILRTSHDVLEHLETPSGRAAKDEFATEMRFLRGAGAGGLTPWDLLEAGAAAEALRLLPQVAFAERPSFGRAFDLLAQHVGDDGASELCYFFGFLSFITADPCDTFVKLAESASGDSGPWRGMRAGDILEQLGFAEEFESYWDLVSVGEPVGTPYVVDPLRAAMQRLGRSQLLETLARPADHLNALEEPDLRALLPPVIVYPSSSGGLVHHLNGVARDDGGEFVANALADVGIFGAAAGLAVSPQDTYCHHVQCSTHPTGLCSHWYNPPTNEQGHDSCRFPGVFAHWAARQPTNA
jgi:hypothetical protein